MRSAVTISMVPEAKGGPFVFWDLAEGMEQAAALGFDAVEIFPPSGEALSELKKYKMKVVTVGTGAGWVLRRLHLASGDRAAVQFVKSIIDGAAELGASAVIGSMQGKECKRESGMKALTDALAELGEYAARHRLPLIFEPLNRYETAMVNTLEEGMDLIASMPNVKLLADVFHMNIEERDLGASLREAAPKLGHVQIADSNRRPAGCGHVDFAAVAAALLEIGYRGYVSAECVPWPDSVEAARLSLAAYKKYFRGRDA